MPVRAAACAVRSMRNNNRSNATLESHGVGSRGARSAFPILLDWNIHSVESEDTPSERSRTGAARAGKKEVRDSARRSVSHERAASEGVFESTTKTTTTRMLRSQAASSPRRAIPILLNYRSPERDRESDPRISPSSRFRREVIFIGSPPAFTALTLYQGNLSREDASATKNLKVALTEWISKLHVARARQG